MDNVRVIRRDNNNHRRKIKQAIQIYKRQPALNRAQGMEIPANTLKPLSCGPTEGQTMGDAAHAHSPEDGSETLAENSGTIFVFLSRLSE